MRLDTELMTIGASLYSLLEGGYTVIYKAYQYENGPASIPRDETTKLVQILNMFRWAGQAISLAFHSAYMILIVQDDAF